MSVLPRWDSMAHGVRTRPAMAVLTSSVGPEVPGPTPQLGLAPESGKEGISDSRRSAAESSFQVSQRPTSRAAGWALSLVLGSAHGLWGSAAFEAEPHLPSSWDHASAREPPAWPSVAAEDADRSTDLVDSEGTEPQGSGGLCPLLSLLSMFPHYSPLAVEGSERYSHRSL